MLITLMLEGSKQVLLSHATRVSIGEVHPEMYFPIDCSHQICVIHILEVPKLPNLRQNVIEMMFTSKCHISFQVSNIKSTVAPTPGRLDNLLEVSGPVIVGRSRLKNKYSHLTNNSISKHAEDSGRYRQWRGFNSP